MRKGFMRWDPAEITREALAARAGKLQAEMKKAGLDGMVMYTNFVRPSAVCYYTAFTPYWNDAILLLPRTGKPVFATALSKRVSGWINSVKPVGELVNTPLPGKVIGERLKAEAGVRRVGILEYDMLPMGIFEDLAAGAPGIEFVDGTETYMTARRGIDATEAALLANSNTLATEGLSKVAANPESVGAALGPIEQFVRLNGGEEIYMGIARDLDKDRRLIRLSGPDPLGERFAVRASTSYKGAWVRRTRTYDKAVNAQEPLRRADEWLTALLRAIRPGASLGKQIADAVAKLPNAKLAGWMAESCVGTYPLAVIASQDAADFQPADGSLLVLTVELTIDGRPWIGAAPIVVGQEVFTSVALSRPAA